jgi:hypothetical protein
MRLERLKSAWSQGPHEDLSAQLTRESSSSFLFLRGIWINDWERAREWSRLLFSALFAFAAMVTAFSVLPHSPARSICLLFAVALIVDGVVEWTLLARRLSVSPDIPVLEFLGAELNLVEARLRLERYSQTIMLALALTSVLFLVFQPPPSDSTGYLLDRGASMTVLSVFLFLLWRRLRVTVDPRRLREELRGYMGDANHD